MSARQVFLAQITEADFQQQIIDYARLTGWRVAHFRPGQTPDGKWLTRMAGDSGFPDLVLARGGVVLHVELKSEKGRLSENQRAWLTSIGETARHWRPSDWDEIVEALR